MIYELIVLQKRPVEMVMQLLQCTVNQIYLAKMRCVDKLHDIIADMQKNGNEIHLQKCLPDVTK